MADALRTIDENVLLLLNDKGNDFIDNLIITFTSTCTWIPLFIGLIIMLWCSSLSKKQVFIIIGGALLCLLFSAGMVDGIIKPLVQRLRPCNEPTLKGIVQIVNGYCNTDYSFFSGHASNTSTIAVYLLLIVRQRRFTILILFWSLLNCYTRLYLAQHYPTDIIVGLIWGSSIGVFLATLIGKHIHAKFNIRIAETGIAISILYSIAMAIYINIS